MSNHKITLRVNGEEHTLRVAPGRKLLDVLTDELGLQGAREGCGIGICGTCTVLLDGMAISGCLLLAELAQGKEILTIEGLSPDGDLHFVQEAFIEHAAFQCAYCTPGFVLSTVSLLTENPNPDDQTIRAHLAGNICRCGSYVNILNAVKASRAHLNE